MTKQDAVGILALLEIGYPNFATSIAKSENKNIRAQTASMWAEAFQNDDPRAVAMAVKAIIYAGDREFAPNIGQVRAKMQQLFEPDELTENEAWALVSRACCNGVYGYKAEFEKLPPVVQAAVGCPEQLREWAMMDSHTVQSVVASNFMRSYRIRAQRIRETEMLPENIRQFAAQLVRKMELNAIQSPVGEAEFEELREQKMRELEGGAP